VRTITLIGEGILWFKDLIGRAISKIREWIEGLKEDLSRAWEKVDRLFSKISDVFDRVESRVQGVINKVYDFRDALARIVLPWWLEPGSPTPLELGLRGINEEMGLMPTLRFAPVGGSVAGGGTTIVVRNTFNRDSIRSDEDVISLADNIQRSLTLRGVRGTWRS